MSDQSAYCNHFDPAMIEIGSLTEVMYKVVSLLFVGFWSREKDTLWKTFNSVHATVSFSWVRTFPPFVWKLTVYKTLTLYMCPSEQLYGQTVTSLPSLIWMVCLTKNCRSLRPATVAPGAQNSKGRVCALRHYALLLLYLLRLRPHPTEVFSVTSIHCFFTNNANQS